MGMIYRITDRLWGISDLPWPFFYGIRIYVIFKIIIGTIFFCLVTLIFPLLYIFGIWYLIKKKKKPDWVYFTFNTALMCWYIFLITKYLILKNPVQSQSFFPAKTVEAFNSDTYGGSIPIEKVCKEGEWIPIDDNLTVPIPSGPHSGETDIRQFRLSISDPESQYDWLNVHRLQQNMSPLTLSSGQISNLKGTYIWYSELNFTSEAQLLNYVCENYEEMQEFKVSSTTFIEKLRQPSRHRNIADEYNDRLDEYLDDPEDEQSFPPELFDFQDD